MQMGLEIPWVAIPEQDHNNPHQKRVEDIKSPFMTQKITIIAHGELSHTKDRSDHDEQADHVEGVEVGLPGQRGVERLGRRGLLHAHLEQDRGDDEKPKHDHLDEEADDDDVVAGFCQIANDHHTCGAALNHEGQDIAEDKDLGEPIDADQRVVLPSDGGDDSAQNHVDRGGEESRTK